MGLDELQVGLEAFGDVPGHDHGHFGGAPAHPCRPAFEVPPAAVPVAHAELGRGFLAALEELLQLPADPLAVPGVEQGARVDPRKILQGVAQGPGIGVVLIDAPAVPGGDGDQVAGVLGDEAEHLLVLPQALLRAQEGALPGPPFHGVARGPLQEGPIQGTFGEHVLGPGPQGLEGHGLVGVPGEDDDGGTLRGPADPLQGLQAMASRKIGIQKHQVHAAQGDALQPRIQRTRGVQGGTGHPGGQHPLEHGHEPGVVPEDQDASGRGR